MTTRGMEEEPLLEDTRERGQRGGFKAVLFILGNDALEKIASIGLTASMILYLTEQYQMEVATASTILLLWSAATNLMPLFGAFLADSYLGRFRTMGFGSIISFLGMILLWSTTIIPQARPPPCDSSTETCESASVSQVILICASFGLISIGAGGVRSCSIAFGADQLEHNFQMSPHAKIKYFSLYYALSAVSAILAQTFVVTVQEKKGWLAGFAVPPALVLFGAVMFFLASRFYVQFKTESNLAGGLVQAAVASYKNRHLSLADDGEIVYHCRSGSALVSPSKRLRFLNKACIVVDPERDLSPDGTAKDPWSLCTVDQVEELKALIKVIPIWSTGMIMSVSLNQGSFPTLQAAAMDRHVTSDFTIAPASFGTFTVVAAIVWVSGYNRIFLPLASKALGRPVKINTKKRMGIGIILSLTSMLLTAFIESIRRGLALSGVIMSALWLIPQHCLTGFAEASNVVAQIEFYFSEFPRSMSSIASTLNGVGSFLASLLASLILNIIDSVSKAGGHESWISSDLNKGHYDYYFLILAGLGLANLVYFVVCVKAYGPLKEEERRNREDNGRGSRGEGEEQL